MALAPGKSRLDQVRSGIVTGIERRGRFMVPIEKIVEDPKNERKVFRNMEGLIASVKSVGIIEPITVAPTEGDSYMIVTGHRRFRAAKAAGLEKLEVLVRDPEAEIGRRRKSIISNVQRENVGPIEMAEALQTLLDEDERVKKQDDLANLIGKDKTWVSGMLGILALPIAVRRKVETSQLSVSYDSMINISRLKDGALQDELVDAVLAGASVREIRGRIDQAKGKKQKRPALQFKEVYRTNQMVQVILEGFADDLCVDRQIAALEEALVQARQKGKKGAQAA